MPTRILEFGGTGILGPSFPVVPSSLLVTEQAALTATGVSALSAAINAGTDLICVQSDEQIYCKVDNTATPTATTNSYRIPAGGEQWFSVMPGSGAKVAIRT